MKKLLFIFLLLPFLPETHSLMAQTITTIAGNGYINYSGDGYAATTAQLWSPFGAATDGSGNLYIADRNNNRIRKVSASGVISTFAGNGTIGYSGDGGAATAAQLHWPTGVTSDGSGNIYIADWSNNVIRKVNPSGIISTCAGSGLYGDFGDTGPATAAQISTPTSVAVHSSGNMYISDAVNSVIRRVNPSGVITTFAGKHTGGFSGDGGPASAAYLNNPMEVVTDAAGNLYIADANNNRIRKINTSGIISTIAGNVIAGFSGDGSAATAAELNNPVSVKVDVSGNIYISDKSNTRIRKVNTSGIINTIAGQDTIGFSGDGGMATAAKFMSPQGIANDLSGNIYVADGFNDRIRKVTPAGIITTFAGGAGGSLPATAIAINPWGITTDATGNLFVADPDNNRICKINPSGSLTTVAGFNTQNGTDIDGPITTGEFAYPTGVAVDGSGNIYFTDDYNYFIRKVNTSGIVSIIAGIGSYAFSGDGGPATNAQFHAPYDIAVDASGNIYIADANNDRIRKINTAGIINTVAGGGTGGTGDGGPATDAQLKRPIGVTTDIYGNIYIADANNNSIRKVNTLGVISTVAGNGAFGYSGDGGAATSAQLNYPTSVKVDSSGNLYIADNGNNRYRKVNALGIITTMAGSSWGFSGDGGPATAGKLNSPGGIAIDGTGAVYISDYNNERIRKVQTSSLAPIKGVKAMCAGVTSTLSDATPGGTWTSLATSIATVGSSSGVVTGISAGTATIVYDLNDNTVTATVTINPLPYSGTITGASDVCAGSAITLTDATTGGVWSSSNTTATVSAGVVTGVSAGTTTISYAVTNICGTATASQSITINPLPFPITGIANVCEGSTTALSDPTAGGAWSSSNTLLAPVGSVSGIVTGLSAGTSSVTYALSTGCIAVKSVTVNPLPGVYSVTGGGYYCAGDTGVHIGLSGSATGIKYQLYIGSTTVGSAPGGTGFPIDFGLHTAAGTYTVVATDISTGCTKNMDTSATITINPLPLAITGATDVCAGLKTTFSDATPGGVWTSSNTTLASVGSTSGMVTGVLAGALSIIYTLPTGCKTISSITVNPLPSAITGTGIVCVGLTTVLIDTTSGGTWSSSSTGISVSSGTVTGISAGTSIVTYLLGTGCAAYATVKVNPLPVAITGTTTVCEGLTATLTDVTAGGVWSSSNTAVATVISGTVNCVSGGTTIITYTLPTGCLTTAGFTVNPLPVPGTITGSSANVCVGTQDALAESVTGGIWSSDDQTVATIDATGVVTGVATGAVNISYSVTNSCGTSSAVYAIYILPATSCPTYVNTSSVILTTLSVYPNPNEGVFTVNLLSDYEDQVSVVITDIVGKQVKGITTVTNNPVNVQLDVAPGIYLLSGTTAHGKYVAKVILE